jgi:uncharacterized membrane protein
MALAHTSRALALIAPACDASGGSFQCELGSFLHWLTIAAVVLAVILIIVLFVALHLYRKHRSSKDSDDTL